MRRAYLFYRFCRFICRCVATVLFKARCRNLHRVPLRGGVLVLSNHQSFMDPALAAMAIPREAAFMARDSLFHGPLFGRLIAAVNAYPVKRGTADLGAIKETMRRLKGGELVVGFPEGTRSLDGRIGPVLAGLTTVAKKCRVPIVPVVVDGMVQAWPRNRKLPGIGDVIIQYGLPIGPAQYDPLTPDALAALVRERMVTMQSELHARVPARRLPWYGRDDAEQPAGQTGQPGSPAGNGSAPEPRPGSASLQ